jgi:hypothetical protein
MLVPEFSHQLGRCSRARHDCLGAASNVQTNAVLVQTEVGVIDIYGSGDFLLVQVKSPTAG